MLTIGKLAQAGGVGVETVRFYQRRNLLGTPSRDGGIRRYDTEDIRRLRFIRKAQHAGFTLEEIRELIELDSGHDHHRAREMAETRLTKLDEQIAELQRQAKPPEAGNRLRSGQIKVLPDPGRL